MSKYLLGTDPEAERREQDRIEDAEAASLDRQMRRELADSMEQMAASYELRGSLPDEGEHRARVEAILRQSYFDIIAALGGRVLEAARQKGCTGPAVRKNDDDVFARIEQRFLQAYGAAKVRSISRTTRRQMQTQVSQGRAAGESTDQIGKRMRDVIPGLATRRAAMISRTESHQAANYAQLETAKETGLKLLKQWAAAPAEGEFRASHQDMDGVSVPQNDKFVMPDGTRMDSPGDPGAPPEHTINCRCATVFVVDE